MKKILLPFVMIVLSLSFATSCSKDDPASTTVEPGNTQPGNSPSDNGSTASVPAADKTGMSSDAPDLAVKMNVGWNLGNSLEAYNTGGAAASSETSWGNPMTTREMIDSVAAAGFHSVRIPVRWYPHMTEQGDTIKIDASWMARLKGIVQYCLNNGMYVIINTHHELWMENYPFYTDSASVYKRERKLWVQIANAFRDYDEHVLFAGTNEVHVTDVWNAATPENYTVQNGMNQVFVNTVRTTGGKNVYRNLIVQIYCTNSDWGTTSFRIPTDVTSKRLMVEVHYYDPWNYCGTDDTKYWGAPYKDKGIDNWGQEDYMEQRFKKLKSLYVDEGYPVILGEYGVNRHTSGDGDNRSDIIASRSYYLGTLVAKALANGIVPFYWDNGGASEGVDQFALFNRNDHMKMVDASAVAAIMKSAKSGRAVMRTR